MDSENTNPPKDVSIEDSEVETTEPPKKEKKESAFDSYIRENDNVDLFYGDDFDETVEIDFGN